MTASESAYERLPRKRDLRPREEVPWRVWVDTGGTFTDCLALDPKGRLHRTKVLSSGALRGRVRDRLGDRQLALDGAWNVPEGFFRDAHLRVLGEPEHWRITRSSAGGHEIVLNRSIPRSLATPGNPVELISDEESPILAARLVTATPAGRALPPLELRLGTTRGTNALLERRGARTLLLTTRGFHDLLSIGDQRRPDLFALEVTKPEPLPALTLEVDERLAADGSDILELDLKALEAKLDAVDADVEAVAVALVHSYRNPRHERQIGECLLRRGYRHVSLSCEVAPFIKLLPRTETTVVNAYLSPSIGDYLDRITSAVSSQRVFVMTSAGGLVRADHFTPKESLLSGPAGGAVGAAQAAADAGFPRVLALDMGGTSTDVSRYDGAFDHRFETRVSGTRVMAPALAIETVAAGGGSICRFDGWRLTVGPDSAGASPGPACYGSGGPLTLTDVNLLLGHLAADRFEIPIERGAAERRADALASALDSLPREQLLSGLLRIANERMAEAIRRISVRRGYRPSDHALVAFGGAGGQHACAVADLLGIDTILIPLDAGLLSAIGVGRARLQRFAQRQLLESLDACTKKLPETLQELESEARAQLEENGVSEISTVTRSRQLDLRWRGQEDTLRLDADPIDTLSERFLSRYEAVFGYQPDEGVIEIESVRVIAEGPPIGIIEPAESEADSLPPAAQDAWIGDGWQPIPVVARDQMPSESASPGPLLITERHATTYVAPGWNATVDATAALVLRRAADTSGAAASDPTPQKPREDRDG